MDHRYSPAVPDNEREWHKSVRCSTTTVLATIDGRRRLPCGETISIADFHLIHRRLFRAGPTTAVRVRSAASGCPRGGGVSNESGDAGPATAGNRRVRQMLPDRRDADPGRSGRDSEVGDWKMPDFKAACSSRSAGLADRSGRCADAHHGGAGGGLNERPDGSEPDERLPPSGGRAIPQGASHLNGVAATKLADTSPDRIG